MNQYSCVITGHRPTRFCFKCNEEHPLCKEIKQCLIEQFQMLYKEKNVYRFYVGGALGVDMWAGEELLKLKQQPGYEKIELIIALPFIGHDAKWSEKDQQRLKNLIQGATECIVISHSSDKSCYKKRNFYMVDHADYLIGVFDNQRKMRSGTSQTVNYALRQEKQVTLIHPDTAVPTSYSLK